MNREDNGISLVNSLSWIRISLNEHDRRLSTALARHDQHIVSLCPSEASLTWRLRKESSQAGGQTCDFLYPVGGIINPNASEFVRNKHG